MIIHLHFHSVPLHFVQIKHIVKCIIVNLPKLSSPNQLWNPPWWYSNPKVYTQTNEYNLENTSLKHNANLKWKLNVMKLSDHTSSSIHDNLQVKWFPFHAPFVWRSCLILAIPNISKALCSKTLLIQIKPKRFLSLLNFGRVDPTPNA